MTAADDLWTAVKGRYDNQALIGLTNVRKRNAGVVDDVVGTKAAEDVVSYFPIYVQTTYEVNGSVPAAHLTVGIRGVIAVLWMRGGTSSQIQRIKWEDWIAEARDLKVVEPRGHAEPSTNSRLQPTGDCEGGVRPCRPWADKRNFRGLMPRPFYPYGPYGGATEWD